VRTVVDASVAAKWYFPEQGSEAADALLLGVRAGSQLLAPDLLEAEFANLLWKKVRRGECDEEIAREIHGMWAIDCPRLVPARLVASRALELSFRLAHPVYDCLYVAVAIEFEAALATADRRLERAARGVLAEIVRVA
jgi:predicted nucleic acid-binding protein